MIKESQKNMLVSVAICTYNRAALLDQTLTSMHALAIPSQTAWELIIVNNNSTDATDDVIAKHEAHLPIRKLNEPQQGKTFALNCASMAAQGDYIIWTDDDVFVKPSWITHYVEAFKQFPNASIFGGPVKPEMAGNPPRWLLDTLTNPWVGSVYAAIDYGRKPFRLGPGKEPYGVNWSVRTMDQKKYLYDTNLGPGPSTKIGYEETDVIQRMFADGLEGRWVPEALVAHYIPENRQTTKYIRWYHVGQGEYKALQRYGRRGYPSYKEKIILIKGVIKSELKYLIYRLVFRNPEIWMKALIHSCHSWGQLRRKCFP